MKYWSKSALSVYKYLEKMANNIDKIILDTGKNSNNLNIQKYQTTMYQTKKILEYMDRKRKIINLKIAVEDSLMMLSKTERRILVLVFIDGIKSDVVAELLGFSLRTFFRKKLKALNNFAEQMIKCGYNMRFFDKEYSTERWLYSVYEECILKYNKDEDKLNSYMVGKILREATRIYISKYSYI